MKFPTGFTYQNLHGFTRFPCDSMALVFQCFAAVRQATDRANGLKTLCHSIPKVSPSG